MKKLIIAACIALITTTSIVNASSITWHTEYEKAVQESKNEDKPIVLFFTRTDWCPWCHKLEREILKSPDFIADTAGKYVFLRLDLPSNNSISADETAQIKELEKKFQVNKFPTLVILSTHQQKIGEAGYRAGGGKAYSNYIANLTQSYDEYQKKVSSLDTRNFSSKELIQLYHKSKELNRINDSVKIVKAGMESEARTFFMLERYRFLVEDGHTFDDETIRLKQKILSSDPTNSFRTHYHIAVIDYEKACEEMEKENYSPEITVAPLVTYIDRFGEQDKEHLCGLQMVISQVFFDRGKLNDALKYAESAYLTASPTEQPNIANAIKHIQIQLAVD